VHDRFGPAVVEDESDAGCRLPGADGDGNRADTNNGQESDDELRPVAEDQRDPIAFCQASPGESGCQGIDLLVEVTVGEAALAVDDSRRVCGPVNGIAEHNIQRPWALAVTGDQSRAEQELATLLESFLPRRVQVFLPLTPCHGTFRADVSTMAGAFTP
jgi:hypothetical protein